MTRNDLSSTHRLRDLLGARVSTADGRDLGHINDLRLATGRTLRGNRADLVIQGMVLSDRHAGSMLGYDRNPTQGPWLVRAVVRRLHRSARYLPWSAVTEVSWVHRHVVVDADMWQNRRNSGGGVAAAGDTDSL